MALVKLSQKLLARLQNNGVHKCSSCGCEFKVGMFIHHTRRITVKTKYGKAKKPFVLCEECYHKTIII